jgi:predicted outer membrane lipoprotein
MRKGEEMNILLLACAGGVLVALVAVAADLRKRRSLAERLNRHLKWHEMEAATREKAMKSIDETVASLDAIFPVKQPPKKPSAKKAALKKGGKKA